MRTLNVAFLVVNEGKNPVEEFPAILAEELIVGHGDLLIGDGKFYASGSTRLNPRKALHSQLVNECNRDFSPIDTIGSQWEPSNFRIGDQPLVISRGSHNRES
jgi:hypothetical protein